MRIPVLLDIYGPLVISRDFEQVTTKIKQQVQKRTYDPVNIIVRQIRVQTLHASKEEVL